MAKQKSTRETKNMIQTALWLPRDMHKKLKNEGGERGLGEEIRRLINEAMEAADAARTPDENTHELLDLIKEIADLSLEEPWYADRFAFDVFKAAINTLLSSYQPSGEAKPETRAKFQATWGDENPETLGRMIARVAMHAHARDRYGQAILDKMKERKG
jgi:NTP pyrophosphatase (non-canonical NTP hydrolase)